MQKTIAHSDLLCKFVCGFCLLCNLIPQKCRVNLYNFWSPGRIFYISFYCKVWYSTTYKYSKEKLFIQKSIFSSHEGATLLQTAAFGIIAQLAYWWFYERLSRTSIERETRSSVPLMVPMRNTHHCCRLLNANELSIEEFDFNIYIFYVWITFNLYVNYLEHFLNINFVRSEVFAS